MKKNRNGQTKDNSVEGVGVRTDLNTKNLYNSTDQYAGDSVDEHKELENANALLAEEEIKQVRNNQ